jgi:hypothetical protein
MAGLLGSMTSQGITIRLAPEGPSRAGARNRKVSPHNLQKRGKIEYAQGRK